MLAVSILHSYLIRLCCSVFPCFLLRSHVISDGNTMVPCLYYVDTWFQNKQMITTALKKQQQVCTVFHVISDGNTMVPCLYYVDTWFILVFQYFLVSYHAVTWIKTVTHCFRALYCLDTCFDAVVCCLYYVGTRLNSVPIFHWSVLHNCRI